MNLDEFTLSYITTALWSSLDDKDQPLDSLFGIEDIDENCLVKMIQDCKTFQENNAKWLIPEHMLVSNHTGTALQRGGHDFWLTRNGHGAGFWDGDWSMEADFALTKSSKSYGPCDLYVNYGKICCD